LKILELFFLEESLNFFRFIMSFSFFYFSFNHWNSFKTFPNFSYLTIISCLNFTMSFRPEFLHFLDLLLEKIDFFKALSLFDFSFFIPKSWTIFWKTWEGLWRFISFCISATSEAWVPSLVYDFLSSLGKFSMLLFFLLMQFFNLLPLNVISFNL
jgi:hypothetical protein